MNCFIINFVIFTILYKPIYSLSWAYTNNIRDNPWDLFPPQENWPRLFLSLKDNSDVYRYVNRYTLPFSIIQNIERQRITYKDTLRYNLLTLINYTLSLLDRFEMNRETFQLLDLDKLTTVINENFSFYDPIAYKPDSIFNIEVVRSWSAQRICDIVIGSNTYYDFCKEKNQLKVTLNRWKNFLKQASYKQLNTLIAQNLDFEVIKQLIIESIMKIRSKYNEPEVIEESINEIQSLGNDASDIIIKNSNIFTILIITILLMVT